MDSRTVSCYFEGYSERFKFYDPSSRSFFETENARFLEDVKFEEEYKVKDIVFEEEIISLCKIDTENDQTLPTV